jgi:hypothetical protein
MLERGYTFDESTHSYARGGRTVPSVTRVLDHAGLVSYDMVRKEVLERKSLIGRRVHEATQYYDQGDLDWTGFNPDNPYDVEIKGRTEAWANFCKDIGFVPRVIEERYTATIQGMTYGLTVDREGLIRDRECIIDIKNAATIEPWVAIQTAGYALGVPDPLGRGGTNRLLFIRRRRMAVQLFPDGSYKKYEFEDRGDAEVFIAALYLAQWKLSHGTELRPIEEE